MTDLTKKDLPILAFDMDGTLLSRQDGIHPRDMELLTMSDPPAVFVPATGRSLFAIRQIFRSYGAFQEGSISFPMVLQNGSLVYNPGEKKLRCITIGFDVQTRLIQIFQQEPRIAFLFFFEDCLKMLNDTPFGRASTSRYMYKPIPFEPSTEIERCNKILCMSDNASLLVDIREKIRDLPVEAVYSLPTLLEINAKGVNKGAGLEYLAEYNGWDKKNVFCVGDGDNDVEMFRAFENSFAPLTSPEHIQKQAKHVIDTRVEGLLTPMLKIINQLS